jgi:hypothetical protein
MWQLLSVVAPHQLHAVAEGLTQELSWGAHRKDGKPELPATYVAHLITNDGCGLTGQGEFVWPSDWRCLQVARMIPADCFTACRCCVVARVIAEPRSRRMKVSVSSKWIIEFRR